MIAIFFQSLHDMIKQMLNVISGNIYYNMPVGQINCPLLRDEQSFLNHMKTCLIVIANVMQLSFDDFN